MSIIRHIDYYVYKNCTDIEKNKCMGIEKRSKILTKAMEIFSKRGYAAVSMKEIADAMEISRPGLYLYFKTKEEIFNAVVGLFSELNLEKVKKEIALKNGLESQLHSAFEIGIVDVFQLTVQSPEAKEISDSSLEFAKSTRDLSYGRFAAVIASILRSNGVTKEETGLSSKRIANLLVSSARGFKSIARDPRDLREMIHDLITLILIR